MISVEMKDGISLERYKPQQENFMQDLEEFLSINKLAHQFKIDASRIAIDVQDIHVGKGLGARKILDWLTEKDIRPRLFITFGDSKSDIEMPIEIHGQGLPVTFVFVGEKEQLEGQNLPFPVVFSKGHCEEGTLEYLQASSKVG